MDTLGEFTKSAGLKIGLLGGSFDPPHEGHLYLARDALARFALDRVCWVVTIQNSLKKHQASSFVERIALCQKMIGFDSAMWVSDIENTLARKQDGDIVDTYLLIQFLQSHFPSTTYYWIAGSDTLLNLHMWPRWLEVLNKVKTIIYERPGFAFERNKHKMASEILTSQFDFDHFIKSESLPPCWTLVQGKQIPTSSTDIRARKAM